MVRVAVGQICSTASMGHNLAQCQQLADEAVAGGAKILFLPEASDYVALNAQESLSLCQPATESLFVQGLIKLATKHNLHINVGIHEPTTPPSHRLSNTLIWISPKDGEGSITHRYAKLHVFDIDLSSTGGPKIKESDSTEPGKSIVQPYELEFPLSSSPSDDHGNENDTVTTTTTTTTTTTPKVQTLKLASQICFDMRFPEPALSLCRGTTSSSSSNSNVLLYPSAFTVPTGLLHWEVLLRARAIENQCYVIASAQCGRHNSRRTSYGETMVVDPDGKVLGRLERVSDLEGEVEGVRRPGVLVVDLDLEVVERARRGIPLLRRGDVYGQL